jgi:hypothetical protein
MRREKEKKGMHKAIDLIRSFFGATNQEMMKMSKDERGQLASGVARTQGLTPDTCEFELVAY